MIYYVDSKNGNDTNSGKSEANAFKTLNPFTYNSSYSSFPLLKYGDTVKIKRGSVLYGSHIPYTGLTNGDDTIRNFITYTTYGTGEKPKLSCARIITNQNAFSHSENNIWVLDLSDTTYAEGYVSTNANSFNIGFLYDDKTDSVYGNRVFHINDLVKKGDFLVSDHYLYVYSNNNPFNFINKIICSHPNDCLLIPTNNMIIENLCFTEIASHGIKTNTNTGFSNIIIRNNDFINLGGQLWSGTARLGNGVEVYGRAHDIECYQNRFINNYDTATTCQGNNAIYENISFHHNYMEKCTNIFEIWCDAGQINPTGFLQVKFNNNISYKNGYGFGGNRSNDTALLLLSQAQFNDVEIKNNIIIFPHKYILSQVAEKNIPIINNKFYANDSILIDANELINISELQTYECMHTNVRNNKGYVICGDNINDIIACLSDANLEMNKLINGSSIPDIQKTNENISLSSEIGQLTINIASIINDVAFIDFSFRPTNNVNAWSTFAYSGDMRLRPQLNQFTIANLTNSEINFDIFKGEIFTNTATYFQASVPLVANTNYRFVGYYKIEN